LSIAIPPYATHYVELLPEQGAAPFSHTLRLEGPAWTRLVPVEVRAGTRMWWSNRGDAGHSWLQRRIDLRGVSHAELTYDLWYDIEWGWDWAGVRVSTDEGENWEWVEGLQSVVPPPGTGAPEAAYTGRSGVKGAPDGSRPAEWVQERIDLGSYAGREILVRFDMVTDDAVNEPGLCIDNLAIDAIEWRNEDEASDDGWVASGFAPIGNQVPLEYLVQAVTYAGDEASVSRLEASGGHGEWQIADLGRYANRVVLVISALTDPVGPISTEDIRFTLTIDRVP
ncbi:MAG: immune inhibitor A, partial [Anaerolineae bacterium]